MAESPGHSVSKIPAKGLLLVGHGTRDPRGVAELLSTAQMTARSWPEGLVEGCFLERAEPTIRAGLARLVDRGARRVTVMPLLLFAAGHVRRDIPAAIHEAAENYPSVEMRYAPHLGCHEEILKLSAERFHQALQGRGEVRPQDTCLLMVGRGSRDDSATREMLRFTELRTPLTPVGHSETCFLAMAEPSLDRMLEKIIAKRPPRVVVQPHLLFCGDLLRRLGRRCEQITREQPATQWIVTPHLGSSERLALAIQDIVCGGESRGALTALSP